MVHNTDVNCVDCPLAHEYRDTAALTGTLRHAGRTYGVLVVALPVGMADDEEEQSLFKELAGDLGYALHSMEIDEAHRQAEQKVLRMQQLLDETGDMARVGGWEIDLGTNTVIWTRSTRAIHEVPDDHVPTLEESLAFFPEAQDELEEAIRRAREEGTGYDMVLPFVTAKGRKLWTHTIGKAEMQDGKCVRIHGTFQDVTEQKESQDALLEANIRFHETVRGGNIGPLGLGSGDKQGQLLGGVEGSDRLCGR